MKNLKWSLACLFTLFAQHAFASTPLFDDAVSVSKVAAGCNTCSPCKSYRQVYVYGSPYIDLGLGWTSVKNPDGQVNFTEGSPDLYLSDSHHKDGVFLAGSVGYAWFFDNASWLPAVSLGLEYSAITHTHTGQVEEFADLNFINYNYKYNVSSDQLSLLGKLDIYRFGQFMPFILAGIGNSWNHFSGYEEAALPGIFPRVSPNFSDNTKSNVSYTLGIGLDYQLLDNFIVDIAYRYDNFGKINSGLGAENSGFSSFKLTTGSIYTNTVMLNVRYLFA